MVGIWTEIRASNLERQVGLFVAMSSGVCTLTIRKVCTKQVETALAARAQSICPCDEAYIFILLCHLTFRAAGRWLNGGLLLLSVMWSFINIKKIGLFEKTVKGCRCYAEQYV